MSVTHGFYNSKNGDRKYDAIQMSSIFDGIIVDGVLMHVGDRLMVSADGESMTVKVATGRAWFNHTWTLNDSILPLEVPQAEMILDRIDAVVLDIDSRIEFRENSIKIIKGVGSTDPQRPVLLNEIDHHQYPLAYIKVAQMATTIRQADITNMVGTSDCPYCTAPLEKMDIDELIAQWGDQWNEYYETKTTEMNQQQETWNTEISNYFDGKKAEFNQQEVDLFHEFNEWFATIQDVIDENVAATLAAQIIEIQGKITALQSEMTTLIASLKDEIENGTITAALAAEATHALTADSAGTAGTAAEATHAASADSATNATYAETAGVANSANAVAWANVSGKPATFPPSAHNQGAATITAGTFRGVVSAVSGTDYGTERIRNLHFGTADLTPGISAMVNGSIYGVYE